MNTTVFQQFKCLYKKAHEQTETIFLKKLNFQNRAPSGAIDLYEQYSKFKKASLSQ